MGAPARDEWVCPQCAGSGFVLDDNDEAVACRCRETRLRRARSAGVASVIPRRYRGVSFDRSPVPELNRLTPDLVSEVRRFIREIDKNIRQGRGLWITGDVGTGKSTLAMLISKAAIDAGHTVAIYSVPRLLAEIRDTYDTDHGERSYMGFFQRLTSVDLLHLEDLGAEKQTDWVLEQLYSLVNERYENERSIVATTNLPFDDLEGQIGPRTASRLTEICGELWFLGGPDRRILYDPARTALG